jgi:hypothetical protein
MNKEKVKLMVKNMELLVRALKEELDAPDANYAEKFMYEDYDEVFEDQ